MRNKVAKKLKRFAEKETIGKTKAFTEKAYNNTKYYFKKIKGGSARGKFISSL